LFGLKALRHVITPSVSFGWSPAITKNDIVKSYVGVGGGGGKSKSFSFSLQNLFQAKIKKGEEEKKLDLVRITSRMSYNLEAPVRKFSNLSTTISSSMIKKVNLSSSIVHDLYDDDNNLHFWSPRLRTFSLQASFQAKGSVSDDYGRTGLESSDPSDSLGASTTGLNADVSTTPSFGSADWNAKFDYHYSESRSSTGITGKSHRVNFTFNMSITTNWKLKYSQIYDFVRHETINKIIDLHRQIHCWEGHFYWIPDGSGKGFYFKINVISIPDIKFEKSESGLRGALLNR
jgi:lipopolysaccharide assembly outer membrane protein LptD (OstA)